MLTNTLVVRNKSHGGKTTQNVNDDFSAVREIWLDCVNKLHAIYFDEWINCSFIIFQIVYDVCSIHNFVRKIHENIFTITCDKRCNGGETHHMSSLNITIIDHANCNKRSHGCWASILPKVISKSCPWKLIYGNGSFMLNVIFPKVISKACPWKLKLQWLLGISFYRRRFPRHVPES